MIHRYAKALLSVVAALAVCVVLSGCGGKVTKDNYDKLKDGMTEKEVEDILGKPTETKEVDIPDAGKMLDDAMGAMGGMMKDKMKDKGPKVELKLETPKKAKESTWKSGSKEIKVVFWDGKLKTKNSTGL